MDEQELTELEKLCEQATPGPWFVRNLDDSHFMNIVAVSTVQSKAHLPWPDYSPETIVAATLVQEPRYVDHAAERWDEDAAFIAAARTALPRLIDEVRALRQQEAPLQPSYEALVVLMNQGLGDINEEGFNLLLDRAKEFADRLIDDLPEENGGPRRFWFLELICEARTPDALPVFLRELSNPDIKYRRIAAKGLRELGTPEAIDALVKAGVDPSVDPWEQEIPVVEVGL